MVSRCIATFGEGKDEVYSVAVMKNKKQFVSATKVPADGYGSWLIELRDIETGRCVKAYTDFTRGRDSSCRIMSVDDESFLCHFYHINTLVLYDITSDEYVRSIDISPRSLHAVHVPLAVLNRNQFVAGANLGRVRVWSFDTGECQKTIRLGDNKWVYQISKVDDKRMLCFFDNKGLLVNVETGEVQKRINLNRLANLSAALDSERFLTVQNNYRERRSKVKSFSINTGECIQTTSVLCTFKQILPVPGWGVLLIHHDDSQIKLSGNEMENPKKCFIGHKDQVHSIDVIDDKSFISGSHDGTIKIWDLSRWPDLKTLVCLRKLVVFGRAEKGAHSNLQRSKRLRDGGNQKDDHHEMLPFLHALVCETSDDIFRNVLSFVA